MHKRRASTFFAHFMCPRELRYSVSKMASVSTLILFLFLFFATTTGGEMKKSVDKIIIHVPYKIHKHHHTHTKYKVITVPAPKKENTVIYLKEQIQPLIKEVPLPHPQVEITQTQPSPEMIIPPHQESAQTFLESMSHQNNNHPAQSDPQKEYSTIADDQKPLETHSGQALGSFIPSLPHKPVFLPPQANFIHDFALKPLTLSPHQAFTPQFFINPDVHHSQQNLFPKFPYQPLVHLPRSHFTSPHKFRAASPDLMPPQDSVAHTSSQVYRTILPTPKAASYQVREESQEGGASQLVKHQQHPSNAISVPSVKSKRKGKTSVRLGHSYQLRNLNKYSSDSDYEYEHVGYLIIDGNSRKLVGKNFKDELVLAR